MDANRRSRWKIICGRIGLNWNFFVMTFPLWSSRVAVRVEEDVINVFYGAPKRKTKTEEEFLVAVARFAARTMDRIFRHEGVECEVRIWAAGWIGQQGLRERVWKGLKLSLDNRWKRYRLHAGRLSKLAFIAPQQYLDLCSFRWVHKSDFPAWPRYGGPLPTPAGFP